MKQSAWHHHSAKEREVAFRYLKQGKTNKEVAELCNVSVSTIKSWKRTKAFRGQDYQIKTKPGYRTYPIELKKFAVRQYLEGKDATKIAAALDILDPKSITTWARDIRFRGEIGLEEEKRPEKNLEKHRRAQDIKNMTPEEELKFLRMENAILKKAISLRSERQQRLKR